MAKARQGGRKTLGFTKSKVKTAGRKQGYCRADRDETPLPEGAVEARAYLSASIARDLCDTVNGFEKRLALIEEGPDANERVDVVRDVVFGRLGKLEESVGVRIDCASTAAANAETSGKNALNAVSNAIAVANETRSKVANATAVAADALKRANEAYDRGGIALDASIAASENAQSVRRGLEALEARIAEVHDTAQKAGELALTVSRSERPARVRVLAFDFDGENEPACNAVTEALAIFRKSSEVQT